jgi:CHASE2 domain-containing sensor protein
MQAEPVNWQRQISRRMVGGLVGALLASAVGLTAWFLAKEDLAHLSYDLPFCFRAPIRADEGVIVYLDEASHTELKQPFGRPWDRLLHARLVEQLTADGARAVVFDIAFSDPSADPSVDEQFAKAMLAHGKVVLPVLEAPADDPGVRGMKLEFPCRRLRDAAVGLGLATLDYDEDQANRRHPAGTEELPSLAWAAAQVLQAATDKPLSRRLAPPLVQLLRAALDDPPRQLCAGARDQ